MNDSNERLYTEAEFKYRLMMLDQGRWVNSNDQEQRICRMSNRHVANIIKAMQNLDRKDIAYWPWSLRHRIVEALQSELDFRGISLQQALADTSNKYRRPQTECNPVSTIVQ